jgi:carboxymethylenebutenolidase
MGLRRNSGVVGLIASAGYRALAPDLYAGKLANSSSEAGHMMANLDFLDASDQDILGAVQYLKRDSKKIVVGGFCMGGALTILSAVRLREMDAGVCFYGIPTLDAEQLKTIHVPLICHFANSDDWCTPEKVNVLEASLKESRSAFELYRYDAHHGFMNPRRGRAITPGPPKPHGREPLRSWPGYCRRRSSSDTTASILRRTAGQCLPLM